MRHDVGRAWGIVGVLCLLLGAAAGQDVPARLTEVQVKSFGTVATAPVLRLALSRDGMHFACWSMQVGGKTAVVRDGKSGQPYDQVSQIVFSPDGKRLAYAARRETVWFLVCDEKEAALLNGWQSTIAFSPDGKHLACQSKDKDGKACIMVDGNPHRFSGASDPVFSPDGKHLAYRAAWNRCIICDGREGPRFGKVGLPVFSSNSKYVAYTACRGERWYVVCGKKRYGPYEEVGTPVFKPKSKTPAFRARVKKEWFVVCGKKTGPAFEACGDPVFSPDAKHFLTWATKDGETRLLCDGKKGPGVGTVQCMHFSRDGKHLVCVLETGMGAAIVCDGVEGPSHGRILLPERFDAQRGKLRYVTIDNGQASLVEADWPDGRTWKDAVTTPKP